MVTAPQWMVDVVVGWLDSLPPGELDRLATAEAPVADQLLARYPAWQRRFARGYLGEAGLRELRQAGPAEWRAVVDAVLATRPEAGLVLWAHEVWFISQLDRARTLFLTT